MKCKKCSADAIAPYGYCGPCLGARAKRRAGQQKLLKAGKRTECADCGKREAKKGNAYCDQCYRRYKSLTKADEELDQLFESAISK